MRIAVIPLAFSLLLGGCYTRQPLSTLPPPPNTRIVATLTDQGTLAMGNNLGPGAMEVEGVVSAATDTAWTLQMLRVEHRDGRTVPWSRELVSFPRAAVTNPFVVVLDKRRSWLAAGGTIIGALILGRAFNVLGSDGGERNGDGTPPVQSIGPRGR
jgi:hypothetical protein